MIIMSLTNWQIRTTVENISKIALNMEKLAESASITAKSHEKVANSLETLIKMLKTE